MAGGTSEAVGSGDAVAAGDEGDAVAAEEAGVDTELLAQPARTAARVRSRRN
jgi:hypothetical protein